MLSTQEAGPLGIQVQSPLFSFSHHRAPTHILGPIQGVWQLEMNEIQSISRGCIPQEGKQTQNYKIALWEIPQMCIYSEVVIFWYCGRLFIGYYNKILKEG